MYLYYDRMAKMYTLETDDDVEFLGPMAQTMLILKKKYDMTFDQARGAAVTAYSNAGAPVDIEFMKKIY